MQSTFIFRGLGLVTASLLLVAALAGNALFVSSGPGGDLEPVGGAERMVQVVQGSETLLWTSLAGTVRYIQVLGWPVSDGIHELGGTLVVEQVGAGEGVIGFAEKPMTVEFVFEG